jgi:K+-sensing histidine kinase KdpD
VALDNAHRFYETEQNLHALVEFGQAITDIHIPRQELLELIREKANKFLDADNMFIALCTREDEKDIVKFEIVYRDGKPTSRPDRPAEDGRVGEIIRTRKAIFLPTRKDIEAWLELHPDHKEAHTSNSWLGVPMIAGDKVLGVIGVDHPLREKWYNGEDQEILQALANLAAIALENSRLYTKARDDLIASQQLATLGTAIAALQHRIGNTLNIISPNVKRLRDRLNTNDPQVDEILGIIDRNTRYTSNLLTRIQEPLQEVTLSNVDVNAVVTEIFYSRRKEWVDDKTHWLIESHIELGKDIPVIPLPVGQLSEVLSNLIDNAYRALGKSFLEKNMKDGAKLQVTSKLEGATIRIRVIDNVPGGIPLSVRNKIFEKPVPSKTPNEGSGLGLWLSKLIMQRIGGNIRIEHTGLTGTTMLVEIPTPDNRSFRDDQENTHFDH